MSKRIDKLTDKQKARFDEWADKWIEIGLRTGPADRTRFESAVRDCYRYADLEPPKIIVWTTSPLAVVLAGPIAAYLISVSKSGAVRGAVHEAVGGAVECIRRMWTSYLGGQFWVSGWWWGGSWTSYFREVCGLELENNLWSRALAYEATMESACWWFPHKNFIIVSERPISIHRELIDESNPRGFGSHRLHCETGPAVIFPDGWGVWSWHGVTVTQQITDWGTTPVRD